MKFKTTSKQIKNGYNKILSISYGGAQSLLRFENAAAYACGVYGWNYDVYTFGNVGICTGYRSMPGASVDYDLLKDYETRAEKIINNYEISYDERRERVTALLREFIKKATA